MVVLELVPQPITLLWVLFVLYLVTRAILVWVPCNELVNPQEFGVRFQALVKRILLLVEFLPLFPTMGELVLVPQHRIFLLEALVL